MEYPIYEEYDLLTGEKAIKKIMENEISYIPMDESNSDYQRYLAWLNGMESNGNNI